MAPAGGGRRGRRLSGAAGSAAVARGAGVLGGLLSRRQAGSAPTPRSPSAAPRAPAPRADPRLRSRDPRPAAPEPAPDPVAHRGTVVDALYAFNHSDHRRTVAGLTRTLGPPRATALAIRTGNGDAERVRLTIAWELTWYQWEVAAAGARSRRPRVGQGRDDRAARMPPTAPGT